MLAALSDDRRSLVTRLQQGSDEAAELVLGKRKGPPCCTLDAPEPARAGRCQHWVQRPCDCMTEWKRVACPVACAQCAICRGHPLFGFYASLYTSHTKMAERYAQGLLKRYSDVYVPPAIPQQPSIFCTDHAPPALRVMWAT